MTATETLHELAQLLAEEAAPAPELATVARPAGESTLQEARYLPLDADAREFFKRITAAAATTAAARSLRPLDPTYKPEPDTIEWAPLADVPAVALACERYSNLSPLGPFQPDDDAYKKRLLFWSATTTLGQRRAFFFRAFSATAELKRKRGAALFARDGSFHRVEEQIFLFDENVDCIVFEEYLYVLRKHDYRRIFDQLEEVRSAARRAANALHARVPIANLEEFATACANQPAMADKLIAVEKRDYFSQLTYDMLEPVIAEFQLDIPLDTSTGGPQLVFRGEPEHRWRILRLVDDDYLKSGMTNHRYEVNSKTTA